MGVKLRTRVHALSLAPMLDNDDRQALRGVVGVFVTALLMLAVAAVSGAGILGLAVRAFQLTSG
jgi:hypothetical protein